RVRARTRAHDRRARAWQPSPRVGPRLPRALPSRIEHAIGPRERGPPLSDRARPPRLRAAPLARPRVGPAHEGPDRSRSRGEHELLRVLREPLRALHPLSRARPRNGRPRGPRPGNGPLARGRESPSSARASRRTSTGHAGRRGPRLEATRSGDARMSSRTLARRLVSFRDGRALPCGETRHLPIAQPRNLLMLAFLRMGGESSPWAVGYGR